MQMDLMSERVRQVSGVVGAHDYRGLLCNQQETEADCCVLEQLEGSS